MKPVIDILEEKICAAMAADTGRQDCAAIVRPATDAKFGDYQANGVMALAKQLKTNPRKLAEQVVGKLDISDICEPPEIAGPGFINLRLKPEFLAERLLEVNKDSAGLGMEKTSKPKNIVVDFSSPNIAKQMHVGHLRSTIIGDCICRILEFLGHNVIRQNHIGDWGLQFGMLCALYEKKTEEETKKEKGAVDYKVLADFEEFYREAQELSNKDEKFKERSRKAVVGLHRGDEMWRAYWEIIVRNSKRHYEIIYAQLSVTLHDDDIRGESFYQDKLPGVVGELKKKNLAIESDGAVCVFPEGFNNKEGKPLPFIIQKSDGAYLYATTDLAAIRYRVNELKADAIIYVTDSRQKLHFEMLFAVARMAKWDKRQNTEYRIQETGEKPQKVEFVHVMFGSVLGDDGQPLKTRSGENVKLKDLLDEAVERAKKVVEQKNPELSPDKKEQIAKAVGIGAVKYADFSNNRTSDYVFSFDKMLAMDGNTAPYMQYAYARIKSIERKAQSKDVDIETELAGVTELNLAEPAELDLAKYLIRYGEAIQAAAGDYRPNYLTAYLYELAQKFSVFYTNCPVLKAAPGQRPTRLLLCDLTARTIRHGLSELLGIEVVEQM
ncbi:MAG: arginine--tRNA ligase [Sedimentisphaerales bacterium]|nr:arginine--tRNA ligase [Sedimentisphaerales bacterium]